MWTRFVFSKPPNPKRAGTITSLGPSPPLRTLLDSKWLAASQIKNKKIICTRCRYVKKSMQLTHHPAILMLPDHKRHVENPQEIKGTIAVNAWLEGNNSDQTLISRKCLSQFPWSIKHLLSLFFSFFFSFLLLLLCLFVCLLLFLFSFIFFSSFSSLISHTVYEDVKHHKRRCSSFRPQELCESGGGRPGLPVPNSPYYLSGRTATFQMKKKRNSSFRRAQERPELPRWRWSWTVLCFRFQQLVVRTLSLWL